MTTVEALLEPRSQRGQRRLWDIEEQCSKDLNLSMIFQRFKKSGENKAEISGLEEPTFAISKSTEFQERKRTRLLTWDARLT